ncbi:ribosomal L1 domain-containing protein 1-like [Anoplophora glabripennis]|uniref:ribosomal L1 domain-containing protein 1-like n=1 Tax=Anoplophora glabripennis TaxID=217634 RepID=UPI0008749B61|nr:ribosomal L1 domain-containing protein 1-like [Anoplophora glabripennis]
MVKMVKSKGILAEKSASSKKVKKKFSKNSSFSGVESKKSPIKRRKSIAAVLPTPLKKKKEENVNEWTVSESGTKDTLVERKQLVITHLTDDVKKKTSSLKTPKIKKKPSDSLVSVSEKKEKLSDSIVSVSKKKKSAKKSLNLTKQKVSNVEKNTVKVQDNSIGDNEIDSEQKFGIEAKNIAKAVETIIKLRRENPKIQNQLFDDPIEIYLQVCCHKVPRGPSRIIRIPLPNSLLTPDDEVCLIVPEVKGVKNIEHEKHIEHYENLLRTKGVENIKKIMTFHQLRTEHETFEQMLRLVDLYDAFLVDGRISGKVVKKCGKIFYKKRKVPTSVKLQATKLKEHIDKALSKAFFLLHLKGDSYSVQFGHDKMETQDLVDNVFATIECLNKEFPGGFENIKGLHISAARATSIPIYSSFKIPKEVVLPNIKSKKPKAYKTYKGELTTLPNAEVTVKPTGQVIVRRTMEEDDAGEGNNAENGSKKKEGKGKKTKKRKRSKDVSIEVSENGEGSNVEVESKKSEGKSKKAKKRKQIEKVSVEVSENGDISDVEVESKKSECKSKNAKKRKQIEKVSVGASGNVEENSEANFNGNVKRVKKIKVNGVNSNVEKRRKQEVDNKKDVKLETKVKKSKGVVDVKKKGKKNKKVKNQP